jgi:hypothetical protein
VERFGSSTKTIDGKYDTDHNGPLSAGQGLVTLLQGKATEALTIPVFVIGCKKTLNLLHLVRM